MPWQLHPVSFTPEMPEGREVTAGTTIMAMASREIRASLRETALLPILNHSTRICAVM